MDKSQSNKLNSYKSILGVLEKNQGLYEDKESLNRSVKEFEDLVGEINRYGTLAEIDTTGETSAKKVAKEKMARLASAMAASASVYAFESSDLELEAELGVTFTDINYGTDNQAWQRAQVIEAELLKHREHLLAYMISDKDLEELHQHIDVYKESLDARGGAKSGQVAAFRKLSVLFDKTDQVLERKLDRFVLRLQPLHPTFFDAYKSARTIVDL